MDPIPETDTCEEEHKTLDIRSRGWGRTGQGRAEQGRAGQGRAGQGRAEGLEKPKGFYLVWACPANVL